MSGGNPFFKIDKPKNNLQIELKCSENYYKIGEIKPQENCNYLMNEYYIKLNNLSGLCTIRLSYNNKNCINEGFAIGPVFLKK